jgi:hypothetical protein
VKGRRRHRRRHPTSCAAFGIESLPREGRNRAPRQVGLELGSDLANDVLDDETVDASGKGGEAVGVGVEQRAPLSRGIQGREQLSSGGIGPSSRADLLPGLEEELCAEHLSAR